MATPSIQEQRDNLNIGIFLVGRQYGAPLDQILQAALGYNPDGTYSTRNLANYERRFRAAQRVGRDSFRARVPGYFTFNAMPFGQIYVYKVTWYTWVNPKTDNCQTVPLVSVDLRRMRQLRDKDLNTRIATVRGIRAAHNIEEERKAIERQDFQALREIQARMIEDDSLGEILSGVHGLPYADLKEILPQLPSGTFGSMVISFQRTAKVINRLQSRLWKAQARISRELSSWVMLQTGLPGNAPQLALQDAAERLNKLGGA